MYAILTYILYFFIVLYILCLIIAKIYSPFWFHQPVYHIYELYPLLSLTKTPYIKQRRSPSHGIFCNTKEIVSSYIDEISDTLWSSIVFLLQGHYMDGQYMLHHVSVPTIQKQLYGKSFISCFWEERIKESSWKSELDIENLYGFLGSSPKVLHFLQYPEKNLIVHDMSQMCIHEKYKPRQLIRQMIQTHIYHHRQRDPEFSGVYVFQKHKELCKGIVPLVKYQVYTFVLRNTAIHKLPNYYSIRRLNATHIDVWKAIYVQMTNQFDIALLPDMAYTLDWLKNERYFIYSTVYRESNTEQIHGVYFFEKTNISWEEEDLEKPHMLRLTGSMIFGNHGHDDYKILFFRGFLNCLNDVLKDQKDCGILEIPCISDNDILLAKWQAKYEMRNVTDCAYYLYNMVYPKSPILESKIIIL
jgi:hypothetical protein